MEISNINSDNITEALALTPEWITELTSSLIKAESEIIEDPAAELSEKSLLLKVNHLIDSPQKGYFAGRLIAKWYREEESEAEEAIVDAILGNQNQEE